MAQIKLTKNELRSQEHKRNQLQKYLPTLQLKKAMLQMEVNQVLTEIGEIREKFESQKTVVQSFQYLLSTPQMKEFFHSLSIQEVIKRFENIAGVEIPYFEEVKFAPQTFALFDTPYWWDDAIAHMKKLISLEQELHLAHQRKILLEAELRSVSIRVNLFEKILIPRTIANIKKVKIFLGDQQLSAVSQAKVAKAKIEKMRMRKYAGEPV